MISHKLKEHVSIVKQFVEKIIGRGDLSFYEKLIAKNAKGHCPESWKQLHQVEIEGCENTKQIDQEYATAFHFVSVDIEEIVPLHDVRIFARWRSSKIHANSFYGTAATQQKISIAGQTLFRFAEEMKIQEVWQSWDMLGLLQQINWQPRTHNYLDPVQFSDIISKCCSLSRREKECLLLQINGKTAKETAEILSLSRRTIEYYFENIKNKLNCENKKDVFLIARLLEKQNLLT